MSADRAPAAGPAAPAAAPAARGLRPHTPLRTQLVLWVVVLAAVAVGVVAAASALVLRSYLFGRIDNQLWESLRPLSSTGSVGPQGSDHDSDGDSFRPPTLYYSQVYDANGDALGGLGNPLPSDVAEPAMPRLDASTLDDVAGRPFTVNAADGTEWRVLVVRVQSTTSPTAASVAVAVPLNDVKGTVLQLVLIDVVVGLVALLLLAAVAYAVVRSNLRPLVVVEETAEAIAGGDLTRRVPPYDAHTEVGRLAAAINVMLGRIEQAFRAQERSEAQARASEDRMRRFVADASHELRTPLTTIRGFAELYRQGAVRDPAEAQRAMRRIEDAAARMGLLVDDLLLLARLDQQRPLAHEPVDLLTLATDAVHDAAMLGPDHAIRLAVLPGEVAPVVDGDPQRLRQVVSNLLGNAVHHTPPGTQVIVTVGVPADGWALLEVRDDGPGLAPADAERVFERFYRADASRTRAGNGTGSDSGSGSGSDNGGGGSDAPGTGLGLAIVAALVAAHGGTVDVESKPGHGTAFRVRLPLRAGQLR